jgi:hypothetical protein
MPIKKKKKKEKRQTKKERKEGRKELKIRPWYKYALC